MIKKVMIMGVALAALVAGANLCQAGGITFATVSPAIPKMVMDWGDDGRETLVEAMNVHNLIRDVRALKNVERQLAVTEQMRNLEEKQLNALEKCSVDKLSKQFKNPQEVWDKMKAEYDKREKDLSIYVNSAEQSSAEDEQAFLNYIQTGEMTPEMLDERYAHWRIGQEILIDVYQNQDKWGERKSENAPSFPLWEDQKYVFDQEWDSYYTKLNTYFGVPSEGRPIIGDEKYDYAREEDVAKAHQEYVASLAAQSPKKAASLTVDLKEPPKPPRPLPPKNEIVVYLETDTPEAGVYPALPEPWQKYAENNFKDRDPKGEMAEDFSNGLVLKENDKSLPQTNRLVAAAAHKQSLEGMKDVEEVSQAGGDAAVARILSKVTKYIQIPEDADLLNKKTQDDVLSQLKAKKEELLAQAEEEFKQRNPEDSEMVSVVSLENIAELANLKQENPETFEKLNAKMEISEYEQDQNLLKALKKDKEGLVYLNEANAGNIDKLLSREKAKQDYMDRRDGLEKMIAAKSNVQIDKSCLNGGV